MITKRAFLGTCAALLLASSASAVQAGVFEYNPVNVGGEDEVFSGDELVGTFSTGLTTTDGWATFTATGWLRIDVVNLDSEAQDTGGLNADYQLWALFTYDAAGGAGDGSISPFYTITAASIDLYAGEGTNRNFIAATGGSGTPEVDTLSGTDFLLGSSDTVLFGGIVNFANQSFFGLDSNFELEEIGFFFTSPNPFYNLAFQSSSSVLPTLDGSTGTVPGTAEARFARVPEPTSMALLGLGLLALGWTTRRRRWAG